VKKATSTSVKSRVSSSPPADKPVSPREKLTPTNHDKRGNSPSPPAPSSPKLDDKEATSKHSGRARKEDELELKKSSSKRSSVKLDAKKIK